MNEATTVAAVYALSGLMSDARHVGSESASPAGVDLAFKTTLDLVDTTTGAVRQRTISGEGIVPQAKINKLADLLGACAISGGSAPDDGSACDQLFTATNPGTTPATQPNNTADALLNLAHHATGFADNQGSFLTLSRLAAPSASVAPGPDSEQDDWTLAIEFPHGQGGGNQAASEISSPESLTMTSANPAVDSAGDVWVRGSAGQEIEFVGAASCPGAPDALLPIAARSGQVQ